MNINLQLSRDELITCDICLREIPVSEAMNEEAVDYVVYFFGLDCFATWKAQAGSSNQPG